MVPLPGLLRSVKFTNKGIQPVVGDAEKSTVGFA
jgi:hypothetical protein